MEKPNWRVWRLKRDVKVWEVCVLALGFEPPKNFEDLAIRRNTLLRSFPTHEIAKKYEDLLEILIDNLSDDNYFNIYVNPRSNKFGDVRVDEFVAWATSKVDWLKLPPEMLPPKLLAKLPEVNPSSASNNAQAAPEPAQAQTNKKKPQIRNKGQQQIDAIISELVRLDYKPSSLPVVGAGQRSAKAEVSDNLYGHDLFAAPTAFENSWQELARRSLIGYKT